MNTELPDKMIEILCAERGERVPPLTEENKFPFYRALVNVRPPIPASEEFLNLQDKYLQQEIQKKGITDIADLQPLQRDIYLWKGDITTLKCDGIVNAANSKMLGCFCPNHGCIDNAIHTYAGIQLRSECAEIMKRQGHDEPTGTAKITKAYNLPCKYILHTVGPVMYGKLTEQNKTDLANCYRACLTLADKNGLNSLAFCCISTGEYRYPKKDACHLAVNTVREWKTATGSPLKIIFNVFLSEDEKYYERELGTENE